LGNYMHIIPNAADPVEYYEQEIGSGGARIVLSVWSGKSPSAVIVFIPATMVHPIFYEKLLRGFARAGLAVVGLHPVGHGKSPRDVKRYTISDIVQNGRDAVSYAIDRFHLPVAVMGSSQGGIVAAALGYEDVRIGAVFAHNIVMSELSETIRVTRFPVWLRFLYHPGIFIFSLIARVFPDATLPVGFYLSVARISEDKSFWEALKRDELFLRRYSLHFLSSLFSTRFAGLTDGSVRCPVYVIIDKGDRLFTEAYMKKVFDRLAAPHKEIIAFNFCDHMLMYTHPEEVCGVLAPKIINALMA